MEKPAAGNPRDLSHSFDCQQYSPCKKSIPASWAADACAWPVGRSCAALRMKSSPLDVIVRQHPEIEYLGQLRHENAWMVVRHFRMQPLLAGGWESARQHDEAEA